MLCASAVSTVEQMLLVPLTGKTHLRLGRGDQPNSPIVLCADPMASDISIASVTPARMRRAMQREKSLQAVTAGTGGLAAVAMAAMPSWDASGGQPSPGKKEEAFMMPRAARPYLTAPSRSPLH